MINYFNPSFFLYFLKNIFDKLLIQSRLSSLKLPSLCKVFLPLVMMPLFWSTVSFAEPTVTITPQNNAALASNPPNNTAAAVNTVNNNAANPNSTIANQVNHSSNNASNNASVTAVPTMSPNSMAAQLQPTQNALSSANQELLARNAKLQRQVNDLQTQVNVLIYESKGQMFLYGAFTVIISLLVGIFISWLVFVRRQRW